MITTAGDGRRRLEISFVRLLSYLDANRSPFEDCFATSIAVHYFYCAAAISTSAWRMLQAYWGGTLLM